MVGGRWRIERRLSRGGQVVLARDAEGRGFALKTGVRQAIEHEQRMLEELAHPHIVRLIDTVEYAGSAVLVLEWLRGGDLVSLAGLAPRHWLPAVSGLVAALAWLHRHGVAHRDLKARNLMLDEAGAARLIDLGSAAGFGSPWHAGGTTAEAVDPLRAQAPVSAADDCYALAALLHELLYGAPPGHPPPGPPTPTRLHALVGEALAARKISLRPTLDDFAAVIELELQRQQTRP